MSGWDVARKQARHQEALLEKKIESLRSTDASAGGRNGYDLEAATFASEQKLCSDIDAVFIDLTSSVDTMTSSAKDRSQQQQVRRFREILQENRNEYYRIKQNLMEKRESAALFHEMDSKQSSAANSEVDHLLRERRGLESGLRSADVLLDQADATKAELHAQRSTFEGTSRRLVGSIMNAFPMINSWIAKVKQRKQRDQLVLAAVIAGFVLFTIWWLFH